MRSRTMRHPSLQDGCHLSRGTNRPGGGGGKQWIPPRIEIEVELCWGNGEIRRWRDCERGTIHVRKRKRRKVRMTVRCLALHVPMPLRRAAPLSVSFDNATEMPDAPQLPLYTCMQEPTAAAAILCHSLFIDLPAIET